MGLLDDPNAANQLGLAFGLLNARVGQNWPALLTQYAQQQEANRRQLLQEQLLKQQLEGSGLDLTLKKQTVADQLKARDVLAQMNQPQADSQAMGSPAPGQNMQMPGVAPMPSGKGTMVTPSVPMAGGTNVQEPGVTGTGKNQTFVYYQTLAQKMMAKNLPDQARQYLDLAEKYRPKLKDEQVRLQGGKPVVVRNYEDGTTEVSPYQPTANLEYIDTKNVKLPIDKYTGGLGGQPIPMGIDPAEAQRIAIERQNAGVNAGRLNVERQRLFYDTGMGAGGGTGGSTGAPANGQFSLPPSVQAAIAKTTQEGLAKGGVDYKNALDSTVNSGNDLMMRIGESQKALSQFQPGMGAENRLNVARFAQAIGAPDALVSRINAGDVAAKQEFQKLAAQQAMETLKSAMGGTGRITQAEFKVFQQNNPNIELDPRAIQKIYDFAQRVHLRNVTEQNALNGYIQQGGNISQWPTIWTQKQMQAGVMPNPQYRPQSNGWSIQEVK